MSYMSKYFPICDKCSVGFRRKTHRVGNSAQNINLLKNVKTLRSESQNMARHIAMPDNEEQFFVFVNMVINNRGGEAKFSDRRPTHVGPHSVTYERNEVGENFMVVDGYKGQSFIEMILDQFYCLRTYMENIKEAEEYPNASKYDPKF